MNAVLHPGHLLVVTLAGWVNRRQQEAIDYLRTENQILKEACGKKRIRLTDAQRGRRAIKGKLLGRKLLGDIATIVTPDTILRWHHRLVARKWDYSRLRKTVGRPPVSRDVVELVLRVARENRGWGYDRIQGALANLGHDISDTTVGNILREHGMEPAPERKRKTSWNEFIKAHWDVLGAIDFKTVEVWTKGGLVTFYLLFVMELRVGLYHLLAAPEGLPFVPIRPSRAPSPRYRVSDLAPSLSPPRIPDLSRFPWKLSWRTPGLTNCVSDPTRSKGSQEPLTEGHVCSEEAGLQVRILGSMGLLSGGLVPKRLDCCG